MTCICFEWECQNNQSYSFLNFFFLFRHTRILTSSKWFFKFWWISPYSLNCDFLFGFYVWPYLNMIMIEAISCRKLGIFWLLSQREWNLAFLSSFLILLLAVLEQSLRYLSNYPSSNSQHVNVKWLNLSLIFQYGIWVELPCICGVGLSDLACLIFGRKATNNTKVCNGLTRESLAGKNPLYQWYRFLQVKLTPEYNAKMYSSYSSWVIHLRNL